MTQSKGVNVVVIDNFHRHDPSENHSVTGFQSPEDALVYALRRVRSSVEQFREDGQDRDAHYRKWMALGEECMIEQMRLGMVNFEYFYLNPATPEEKDYLSLTPQ